MFAWIRRRPRASMRQPDTAMAVVSREPPVMSGKYTALFNYLNGRYADRVVLTFGQIEDLLGFSLPDMARLSHSWWTIPDPTAARPCFSDSWLLAHRSAQPNLLTLTVIFDRAE